MQALAEYLTRTKRTQTELARACGVSQATISDIVRGEHEPSADLLRKICLETGLSADELLSIETPARGHG